MTGTPHIPPSRTAARRALAYIAVVAVLVAGALTHTTDTGVSHPRVLGLPGATAEPTGPGGPTGPGPGNGTGGGSQFQPPGLPEGGPGYSGGNYPAPPQGNGIDINNPSAAPEYSQAPQYPQQSYPQRQPPVHGTQPPNYDAPLQQSSSDSQGAPQEPVRQATQTEPSELPQESEVRKVSCVEFGSLNPFTSCEEVNERSDLYQKMTSCLGDRSGDSVSAANAVEYGGEIERWTLTDTRTLEKTTVAYTVVCTQSSFIHLAQEHDPRDDPINWAVCVANVLNANQEAAASNPSLGRFDLNYGRGVAVVIFDPATKVIVTTYTEGPQNDWGGCAKGLLLS